MPKLFDFQQVSTKRLVPERSVLNGDDMGLGKTVQAIAMDVMRRNMHNCGLTAQTLVVTKMTVMGSWKDHFEEWAPNLRVFVMNPKNRRKFTAAFHAKDSKGLPLYHVFVCHWPALRFITDELKSVAWFHVVGDEIHAIKNRKAQVTRSFKAMRPYYRTGLSGTWADNNPDDAWSVLNWLWPNVFTNFTRFSNYHTIKVQKETQDGRKYNVIAGTANAEELHAQIAHGYVRRTKEEVLDDLPDKYYSTVKVDLHTKQRSAYNQMRDTMLAWVGEHENEPIAAPMVIAKLVRLQQFACAYGQLETIYKTIVDADGEKQKIPMQVLRLTEPSSKLDAVMEIIDATSTPVVVFSQSKQVINLLGKRLQAEGIAAGILTGDTPARDRSQLVSDFQSGRLRVFAGTIAAGGTGITLTAASTCIFIDRAWSPSQNRQAEDRLHRIGQKNAVHIIDIVARTTIDSGRNRKIALKWEWLREMLGDKGEELRKEVHINDVIPSVKFW